MNEPTRAAGNRQQFQKDTKIDRGWGPCDECGATEVSLCHECPAWVWRKDAEAAGWRHDHIGGFGCISLCPYCRDDNT